VPGPFRSVLMGELMSCWALVTSNPVGKVSTTVPPAGICFETGRPTIYVVVWPAIMFLGITPTGGANPKVVEEKCVGTNVPPPENESVDIAMGPKAPLVVAELAMGILALLCVLERRFPERSFAWFAPEVSMET